MIELPYQSALLADAVKMACEMAEHHRDEFLTPEHLLWGISFQAPFQIVCGTHLSRQLLDYIDTFSERVPAEVDYSGVAPSSQLMEVLNIAYSNMMSAGREEIEVTHILAAMFHLADSFACNALMEIAEGDKGAFMGRVVDEYEELRDIDDIFGRDEQLDELLLPGDDADECEGASGKRGWRKYVVCLNDAVHTRNPLIGRVKELDRTVQVLCRKDKNNPLHVGEAGVGKTAIAYGIAARINSGDVPARLQGARIYSLDLGAMMAGTQYRGDMEKRLKDILEGVKHEGGPDVANILYIDEVHNIVGAGRVEGSSLDASNLMKPYLEEGSLRFMGATTYDEFNRSFSKSKALARRFEKIDVPEPSVDECLEILNGIKGQYEAYHGVSYTDEALEYAVTASDRYISGRFLPDKAIDLMDEAGAWVETNRKNDGESLIGKAEIALVLAKVCNVDTLAEERDDAERLSALQSKILRRVFGQDEAVCRVTEAVQMASAGLNDVDKPMASLLFVGPTGVGKTEVARVLADELSLPLVRFDMSEYAEKHAVAKLIGSPAGYVGYEDGGLLTDAVRKSPHCVLLLDELEKAHSDIFNILLQVMDYAVLTDNRGQKADFRHVILIMTTNSGAQFARQASVGFGSRVERGEAMLRAVKKTFKPEFLNRLTDITVFHDMTRDMAERILDKKLDALRSRLTARNVELHLSSEAVELLLREGFSETYGGREIERVVNNRLKPILMRAILFGCLRNGGAALIETEGTTLRLTS